MTMIRRMRLLTVLLVMIFGVFVPAVVPVVLAVEESSSSLSSSTARRRRRQQQQQLPSAKTTTTTSLSSSSSSCEEVAVDVTTRTCRNNNVNENNVAVVHNDNDKNNNSNSSSTSRTAATTATAASKRQQQELTTTTRTKTTTSSTAAGGSGSSSSYGVDVSFPMHRAHTVSTNYPWLPHNNNNGTDGTNGNISAQAKVPPPGFRDMPLQPLGDMQRKYDEYLLGCIRRRGYSSCTGSIQQTVRRNLLQPSSMRNYTTTGFAKIRAPASLMEPILQFWNANNKGEAAQTEAFSSHSTVVNTWDTPTFVVHMNNATLQHGGSHLPEVVMKRARGIVEGWTGYRQRPVYAYGIRIYGQGHVLIPHVDLFPRISSAIINVDQDLGGDDYDDGGGEPWPLEVIGHDGLAHNVTMLPGDMVLYESHSILHGRPFPFKGRFFANVFIHFEPIAPLEGKKKNHEEEEEEEVRDSAADVSQQDIINSNSANNDGKDEGVVEDEHANNNDDDNNEGLPIYMIPGSPQHMHWKSIYPEGYRVNPRWMADATGSTAAHYHARTNNVPQMLQHLDKTPDVIHARDQLGWTPLHEAVRAYVVFVFDDPRDHNNNSNNNDTTTQMIRLLLERGANVNERTMPGARGETPLYMAKTMMRGSVPQELERLLKRYGALSIGPEQE